MFFLTEISFVSIWKSPNEIFLYITLAFWLPFFKSPRLKQPIFYSFSCPNPPFMRSASSKSRISPCCMQYCVIPTSLPPCLSRWSSEWDSRLAVSCFRTHVLFWNGSWLLSGFPVSPMSSEDVHCILSSADAPGICSFSDSPLFPLNGTRCPHKHPCLCWFHRGALQTHCCHEQRHP